MKKKKKHKKAKNGGILHWIGFFLCLVVVSGFTAYGFLLSLSPNTLLLNSAPDQSSLALVGVAISNNIGTGQVRANDIPVDLPADVENVQDALQKSDTQGVGFYQEHFQLLQEFDEILQIDIVDYLSLHDDRESAIESYIVQLADKLVDAEERHTALIDQAVSQENSATGYQNDVKNLEISVNSAYDKREGSSIIEGFVRLEELMIEQQDRKYASIFSRKLAAEYAALIAASNAKLTVINANKDALIKGVTVTLPAGTNVQQLKDLDIFTTDVQ